MLRPLSILRATMLAATVLAAWQPLSAQSIILSSVSGTVRGSNFQPVGQARVTLTALGSGASYEARTTSAGVFSFELIQPGTYEVRVEAIGFRPQVARFVTLSGGEARSVSLTLTLDPPPVTQVDTVQLGAALSTRWRSGGVQLGGSEIEALPHRFDDLASVAALSTAFDEALGAQGLPGDMTLLVADGVPFYRAAHPVARQDVLPDALFPRSALSGVTPIHNASDVELSGSAGGYATVSTRTSTGVGGVEGEGALSAGPAWSSGQLDAERPSLFSWQAGARGSVAPSRTSRLVLSGEALRQETPLAPRVSEELASGLAGLDPDLVASLGEAGVEQYERYSSLLRFDLRQSRDTRIFLRGVGSFSRRRFEGAGPVSLAGPAAAPEESIEFSTAFGAVNNATRSTVVEFRAGLSGSYRDFNPSIAGLAPAYLTGSAASLGDVPSAAGESSRTDFVAIPLVRWSPRRDGATSVKFGGLLRASSHSSVFSRASLGDYAFSDPSSLLAGSGFGLETFAPQASFGTQEYGAFTQFETRLAPGLEMTVGGRYDYEVIGGDGVTFNPDWFEATGINNTVFNTGHHQFGLRGSLVWEPAEDGRTRVSLTASMHEGDVELRAISALYAESTTATSTRYAGTGINWPSGGVPPLAAPALTTLTLLGPDARAPRSTNIEVSALRRLGETATVFLRASSRRTDYLTRRRNLNLPLVPQALDPYGRRISGTLVQDGSIVTTTASDARRFAGFGDVWALDPDGWSEYLGITAGVEHRSANLDVYGAYTFSQTDDNWVGAGSGSIDASLSPGLPTTEGQDDWSEGTSDFDVPHRLVVGATTRLGPVDVSGTYRFRSGLPFTPGYRLGVDANADGSTRNDVAYVPDTGQLGSLADDWSCLADQAGGFAERNSCRGPSVHDLSLRLRFGFATFGGRTATLVLDGFNLIESSAGVIDNALLLVDPTGSITTSPDGATVTIPTTVNDGFGKVVYPSSRGRMLRIGVRIAG